MNIEHKLTHALTEYDRKQSSRRGYNHYALARYMRLATDVAQAIDKGEHPRNAARSRCCDRLLAVVLRSLGESAPTTEEARGDYMRAEK